MTSSAHQAYAGVIAGAAGKVAEHPLDTVKVRYQLGQGLPRSMRALYRGLPGPLVAACAETGTLFGVRSAVVAVLGDDLRSSSEWGDRDSLDLPGVNRRCFRGCEPKV